MNLWNYLFLFILGIIIFEVTSQRIVKLEENKNFGTWLYRCLIWVAATGAAISVRSLIVLCVKLEKNSNCQLKRAKVDTSLFGELKKATLWFFLKVRGVVTSYLYTFTRELHDWRLKMFKKLLKDKRGITMRSVVVMAVGFLLVAILTPIAMDQVVAANTTLWNVSVKTIFTVLLPILYIIGCAIAYIPKGGGG